MQERILSDLGEWHCSPDRICCALTEDEIPTSDKRVRFIGVDAYLAAGGTWRQDLIEVHKFASCSAIPPPTAD